MNISAELKDMAVQMDLCQEWTERWGDPDKDELLEMYIRGIDFCIEHDWPSCTYLKENFDGIMQQHGVFVNDRVCSRNLRQAILNGTTSGEICYDEYSIGAIYVRHRADIVLNFLDQSKGFIEVYDEARVKINNTSDSTVFVYQYGGDVETTGKVVVKKRVL